MDIQGLFFELDEYQITQKGRIGKGGFGNVYECERINDQEIFAAKIIKKDKEFDGAMQEKLLREIFILKLFETSWNCQIYWI